MPDGPYVNVGDWRYGRTCPICAAPKTVQALRCKDCYADTRRRTHPRPVRVAQAVCPRCGGPMWSTSGMCRACWIRYGDKTNGARHPWRRLRFG